MKRQLHITNWYPNRWQPYEAQFIREHFQALPNYELHQLWHVQVRSCGSYFRLHQGSLGSNEHFLVLDTPVGSWRIKEWLHYWLLYRLRSHLEECWWDVVNVHIAYPLLRFPLRFKKLFGNNVVITEHWSAYHSGFNLPKEGKAKARIAQIFAHGIPVIAVSRALMEDIVRFAGRADFPKHVIPNVVDPDIFYPDAHILGGDAPVFLMVGNWAAIKRPLLILEAFSELLGEFPEAQLRVAGYGTQWEAMTGFVEQRGLESSVQFIGGLSKAEVANELRRATAFLHASDYETFSVVCAEALCCGTPVIASDVGAIPELLEDGNGVLVKNTSTDWHAALRNLLRNPSHRPRLSISTRAKRHFSPAQVGEQLREVLEISCQAN